MIELIVKKSPLIMSVAISFQNFTIHKINKCKHNSNGQLLGKIKLSYVNKSPFFKQYNGSVYNTMISIDKILDSIVLFTHPVYKFVFFVWI